MNNIWQRSEYSTNGVRIFWEWVENILRTFWEFCGRNCEKVTFICINCHSSFRIQLLLFLSLSFPHSEQGRESERKRERQGEWKNQQVFTWVIFLLVSFVCPLWLNYDPALPVLELLYYSSSSFQIPPFPCSRIFFHSTIRTFSHNFRQNSSTQKFLDSLNVLKRTFGTFQISFRTFESIPLLVHSLSLELLSLSLSDSKVGGFFTHSLSLSISFVFLNLSSDVERERKEKKEKRIVKDIWKLFICLSKSERERKRKEEQGERERKRKEEKERERKRKEEKARKILLKVHPLCLETLIFLFPLQTKVSLAQSHSLLLSPKVRSEERERERRRRKRRDGAKEEEERERKEGRKQVLDHSWSQILFVSNFLSFSPLFLSLPSFFFLSIPSFFLLSFCPFLLSFFFLSSIFSIQSAGFVFRQQNTQFHHFFSSFSLALFLSLSLSLSLTFFLSFSLSFFSLRVSSEVGKEISSGHILSFQRERKRKEKRKRGRKRERGRKKEKDEEKK